jgi:hypothetical protein
MDLGDLGLQAPEIPSRDLHYAKVGFHYYIVVPVGPHQA